MLYVVPGEVPEIPQQKCLYIGKISIVRMHIKLSPLGKIRIACQRD